MFTSLVGWLDGALGPEDLVRGTPHLILGIVWQIIRVRMHLSLCLFVSLSFFGNGTNQY
jgi:hypothetical protein